jgi:CDP-diacylglycerol--glycerol-3-phosphate 3-phosphatidyltransferase
MNLPNKLTVARFILTVVFVILFYVPIENRVGIALLVFIAAALTDLADGKIARARGLVTNFGKLMDPLADKVLMTAALVFLTVSPVHPVPTWIVIAVLAREFFVTGIRVVAANNGVILAAE